MDTKEARAQRSYIDRKEVGPQRIRFGEYFHPFSKKIEEAKGEQTWWISFMPHGGEGLLSPSFLLEGVGVVRVELLPKNEPERDTRIERGEQRTVMPNLLVESKEGAVKLAEPHALLVIIWYENPQNKNPNIKCHMTVGDLTFSADNDLIRDLPKQECAAFRTWRTQKGYLLDHEAIELLVPVCYSYDPADSPILGQIAIRFEELPQENSIQ